MNKLSNTSQNSSVKSDFAHFFSNLNSIGLASLLKDDILYNELSKDDWIALFEKQFESFKRNNVHYLNPKPGVCEECKKGCEGFTFLDEDSGFYVDLVIESNGAIIVDFTDCVNLKNQILGINKKEQIFMNDKDLHGTTQEFPF
jgi:predicted metal-binding protein